MGDIVICPPDRIDLRPALVMHQSPIQHNHCPSMPAIIGRDLRTMALHQRVIIPAGFKDPGVHGATRWGGLFPDL